jgi:hypothetical protein
MSNAEMMTEAMFSQGDRYTWRNFEPHHMLALRACTPEGVFTKKAGDMYLKQTEGDPDLENLSGMLFTTDEGFARSLPAEMKPQIVVMMKMAYEKGIRPRDRRI